MYKILPYTYRKAKRLNVTVRPSSNSRKKIDVFNKRGELICSVGARGYLDYPNYLQLFGKDVANEKRRSYKKRHEKDRKVYKSPGWYADQLLW